MATSKHPNVAVNPAVAIVTPAKIPGSASLDELFGNGRNPFNQSAGELHRQMQEQIRNGGK